MAPEPAAATSFLAANMRAARAADMRSFVRELAGRAA